MQGGPAIACTFVGDLRRDSRLLKCARALTAVGEVSVVSLGGAESEYTIDGISVRAYPQRDATLRRALPAFWKEAAGDPLFHDARIVLASDLYSLPLAAGVCRRSGARLVYDSRELYSSIAALASRPLMQAYWSFTERRHARRADAMLTVNDSIAEILRASYPRVPVHVIRNHPHQPFPAEPAGLRGVLGIGETDPILLSQGGMQAGRGAFIAVRAMRQLPSCHLVFLGGGALAHAIADSAQAEGVRERVHILPSVPPDELLAWTSAATLSLCLIEDLGRSYRLSLPNKLFESIAAGVPVIASDLPELARVVLESGAGVCIPPDADALARTVNELLGSPGRIEALAASAHASRAQYRWETEEKKLQTLISGMLVSAA